MIRFIEAGREKDNENNEEKTDKKVNRSSPEIQARIAAGLS